jgi:putative acetyltransferase
VAKGQGLQRLSLETGTGEAFLPATKLYESRGFVACEAFGDYRENSFSRFFTLAL